MVLNDRSFRTNVLSLSPDSTKASLEALNKQIHFPTPIFYRIHQLTTNDLFTVHSLSVCFPNGLFLWPVWHPRVLSIKVVLVRAHKQLSNWLKSARWIFMVISFAYISSCIVTYMMYSKNLTDYQNFTIQNFLPVAIWLIQSINLLLIKISLTKYFSPIKCDWLCENPPCSRANFELFLELQVIVITQNEYDIFVIT